MIAARRRGWSPSVGADVEGEADDGGGEGIQHYTGARQAVEDEKELHQQRACPEQAT